MRMGVHPHNTQSLGIYSVNSQGFKMITKDFTGGELDTLNALVERGPLADGDVPSKSGRDNLIKLGFAMKTVVKGEDGFQVVTEKGLAAYLRRYNSSSIREAINNRKTLTA